MEVIEKRQDGISVVRLLGRLDSNTSPDFEQKLFKVIEDGERSVIVDFEELDYISSAGLSALEGGQGTQTISRENCPLFNERLYQRSL